MKRIKPYWLITFFYLVYVLGGYWLYKNHYNFVNTNFFFATVTLIVGSVALFIYITQKSDEKNNAATTVILEIRNAEIKIEIIKDKLNKKAAIDLPSVLPTNSWRRYSHMFIKDLDLDDVQLLNSFYTSCEIIEDLVNRQNNFVWITTEERAKTVQRKAAELHDDLQIELLSEKPVDVTKSNAHAKYNARRNALENYYSNDALSYAPDKILKGLDFQTNNFQRVTSTSCGEKLKKIANLT